MRPNRRPSEIDVGRPGSSVTLLVFNHSEAPRAGCSLGSGGTTGILTIVP